MAAIDTDLLSKIAIFRGLDENELLRVASLIKRQQHGKGDVITKQGDEGSVMYIIESGQCAITMCSDASQPPQTIAQLSEGDCLGEMALVDIQPRSATITTKRPSSLLSLSNQAFLSIYQSNPATYALILNNICREISRRLRQTNIRLATLMAQQKKERPVS